MSIGTVLTIGYGSFGNKSFIHTLGYGPYDIPINSGGAGGAGGGGGVAKWPGRSEFGWEKWRRKEDAKLARKRAAAERRVEKIETKIREKSRNLESARDLELIQALMADLEKLDADLKKAQAILDQLEMEEVMLVWALTRR